MTGFKRLSTVSKKPFLLPKAPSIIRLQLDDCVDNAENRNHKNPAKYVRFSACAMLHPEPAGYHIPPSISHNTDTETAVSESSEKQPQFL